MTKGEGAAEERFELVVPVRLRACVEADLPALECGGAFAHHRELIREAFARQRGGAVVMIVAEAGRALAGQLWVDLERRRAAGAGFLWALRVASWIEGRGLGTRLLAAGERVAASAGLAAAEIGAEAWNAGALRLYERLGYARVARIAETYGYTPPGKARETVELDEWILRKELVRMVPVDVRGAGPQGSWGEGG